MSNRVDHREVSTIAHLGPADLASDALNQKSGRLNPTSSINSSVAVSKFLEESRMLGDLSSLDATNILDQTPGLAFSSSVSSISYSNVSTPASSVGFTTVPSSPQNGDALLSDHCMVNAPLNVARAGRESIDTCVSTGDLSFVTAATADSSCTSLYASAEEDSPRPVTPPTCVKAARRGQPVDAGDLSAVLGRVRLDDSGRQETLTPVPDTRRQLTSSSPLDATVVDSGGQAMDGDDERPIVPTKGYNLDFLDQLDDPNYDPFVTKSAVTLSPSGSPGVSRRAMDASADISTKSSRSTGKMAVSPVSSEAREVPQAMRSPPVSSVDSQDVSAGSTDGDLLDNLVDNADFSPFAVKSAAADQVGPAGDAVEDHAAPSLSDTARLGDVTDMTRLMDTSNNNTETSHVDVSLMATGDLLDVNVNPSPSIDSFKAPFAVSKHRVCVANVLPMVSQTESNSKHSRRVEQLCEHEQFLPGTDVLGMDALASHGNGKLNPELARNSLYVNFDPILGRPSVAPIVNRLLASGRDDTLPNSVASVKDDLIAFSPGSKNAGVDSSAAVSEAATTAVVEPQQQQPASAASRPQQPPPSQQQQSHPDVASQLPPSSESAVPPCSGDSAQNRTQSAFPEQLLKRDQENAALQESVEKLRQQLESVRASEQKSIALLEANNTALYNAISELDLLRDELHAQSRQLTTERDEARAEIATIEAMFSDLHRKYEKSKQMLAEKSRLAEIQGGNLREALEQVSHESQRHDVLQQYAENTIQQARADMEAARKQHETDMLRVSARLQLTENKAAKLERENQELTALCDELIQKIGAPR